MHSLPAILKPISYLLCSVTGESPQAKDSCEVAFPDRQGQGLSLSTQAGTCCSTILVWANPFCAALTQPGARDPVGV